MDDYEKVGLFYLGRAIDPATRRLAEAPFLYEARDLTTHAVIVGMTGSGKTGLGLVLLEEAAMDGLPIIAIDPKGDLGNLALQFPEMRGSDLRPWIDERQASLAGRGPDEHAAAEAERWRAGLAEWDQPLARIAKLRSAAEVAIFTPGSAAGRRISLLRSFDAPPPDAPKDGDVWRERIASTTSGLLALVGIDAAPLESREHVLLASIFEDGWSKGRSFSLADLVHAVQKPPLERIGVMDVETFFPGKDRFALALRLNALVASPGFAAWTEGEPLDIARLLVSSDGKPRISIFSIAHLGDAERMFFLTILLHRIVAWMRAQSGTSSLRALLYIDEVTGLMPPVANPPSKPPLLTLLKQARAFGLGVVAATQNPVDLDYKALSNAGSWFLGRLQTERDRARVIDALEASAAGAFDREKLAAMLTALEPRTFLLHDIHASGPALLRSRWALSYLRGPMTLDEIGRLETSVEPPQPPAATTSSSEVGARPALPSEIVQYFVPVRTQAPAGGKLRYRAGVLAAADVGYADAKLGVDLVWPFRVIAPLGDGPVPLDWDGAAALDVPLGSLAEASGPDALFASLPSAASQAKSYDAWSKSFVRWVQTSHPLVLLACKALGVVSRPGESREELQARLWQSAREARDRAVDELRRKTAPKAATLTDQLRRAEEAVGRARDRASDRKLDAGVTIGTSILGALLGRRTLSASNVARAGRAVRGVQRASRGGEDIGRAEATVEVVKEKLHVLEVELTAAIASREETLRRSMGELAEVKIKPKRNEIVVSLIALVWVPFWARPDGAWEPASGAPKGAAQSRV